MGQIRHPGATVRSKAERREAAKALATARAERTPQQQIATLNRRLGKGKGATKERARLMKIIANKVSK